VAVVCFPFVGDTVGGSHLSALTLAHELKRGHNVSPLIVLHQEGMLLDHLGGSGLEIEVLSVPTVDLGRPSDSLRQIAGATRPIARFLKTHQVDIVHGNDRRINQTWIWPTRLGRRPYFWHMRGRYDRSRIRKAGMRFSSEVVCVSNYTRSTLPAGRLRDNSVVLYNPVDVDLVDRSAARSTIVESVEGIGSGDTVVGFCATLSRQKRPEVFLRAAAKLAQHREGLKFLFIGLDRDGRAAALQGMADELGIGRQVFFAGHRWPGQLWIAGLDLLICPQVEDAFGRTLVEAMIVGTPVVASRSGGHVELVDDGTTGFLVEPDEPEAFSSAAETLLGNDDLRRRVTQEATRINRDRFRPGPYAEAVAHMYRKYVELPR